MRFQNRLSLASHVRQNWHSRFEHCPYLRRIISCLGHLFFPFRSDALQFLSSFFGSTVQLFCLDGTLMSTVYWWSAWTHLFKSLARNLILLAFAPCRSKWISSPFNPLTGINSKYTFTYTVFLISLTVLMNNFRLHWILVNCLFLTQPLKCLGTRLSVSESSCLLCLVSSSTCWCSLLFSVVNKTRIVSHAVVGNNSDRQFSWFKLVDFHPFFHMLTLAIELDFQTSLAYCWHFRALYTKQ